MTLQPNGTWVIDTLGDLIETGSSLSAECEDCRRMLDLDVYDLAIQFGRRATCIRARFPIRCSECNSRKILYIGRVDGRPKDVARRGPPQNFRPSRSDEERAALEVIFPRRWEWPAKDQFGARLSDGAT